jgi:parvulin-like peptidyl-prolyl isomerase
LADKTSTAVNLVGIVMNFRFLVAAAVATALLAACGSEVTRPAAAVVNGTRITVAEIEDSLDRFVSSKEFENALAGRDPEEFKREYQQTVLSRLIRREVLADEADEAGIEVSDEEVQERLDQVIEDVGGQDQFETELSNRNLTQDEVEGFVRDSLIEEALRAEVTADTQATEDELQEFYEENISRFNEIHTAHILVETNERAIELSQRLKSAPAKEVDELFAELARKFSIDTASAKRGGDLGFVPSSQFVPEYTQAVENLEVGEISDPVRTQFGFHVVRFLDERPTPFEDVRDQLAAEVGGQREEEAWQEFLADAYADADVTVNSRYGELDPVTHTVMNADANTIPGAEEPSPTPTPTSTTSNN